MDKKIGSGVAAFAALMVHASAANAAQAAATTAENYVTTNAAGWGGLLLAFALIIVGVQQIIGHGDWTQLRERLAHWVVGGVIIASAAVIAAGAFPGIAAGATLR